MSLGLPQFGSHGRPKRSGMFGVRLAGFVVLAYVLFAVALEWRSSLVESGSIERARAELSEARNAADAMTRGLQKSSDTVVALASIRSSPARVWSDVSGVLPDGVSISSLKVDYLPDATARLDFAVVARNPEAYDLFLARLSNSPIFSAIQPGDESRPGLVRATVSAIHRPAEAKP